MKIIQSRNAREGHYERSCSRTRYYARSLAYKAKEKRRIARGEDNPF